MKRLLAIGGLMLQLSDAIESCGCSLLLILPSLRALLYGCGGVAGVGSTAAVHGAGQAAACAHAPLES